jgi:ABC-2 type transport system permease protein
MTTLPTATVTYPQPSLPAQITRNLGAEWTKLSSVRSSLAALVATFVICVGFAILLAASEVSRWDRMAAKEHASFHAATLSVSGVFIAQLILGALGVLAISAEYTTGTIRATLSATPQRLVMYLSKIMMLTAVLLVVALVSTTTAFFAAQSIFHRKHLDVALLDAGVARIVVGAALFLVAVGLLGLGLAALLRHTAAAISSVFALMLVLSLLGSFLPQDWQLHVDKWLPLNAGMTIIQVTPEANQFGPWTGLGLLYGYALIALVAGGAALVRRDA